MRFVVEERIKHNNGSPRKMIPMKIDMNQFVIRVNGKVAFEASKERFAEFLAQLIDYESIGDYFESLKKKKKKKRRLFLKK